MTFVYAWPPVGLTAWELTRYDPVSRSVGLFSGRARTSSFQRSRRLASARVTGIGADKNGAGYMENLKRLLDGGVHLVRIEACSMLYLPPSRINLANSLMQWVDGSAEMVWTDGSTGMVWTAGEYALSGEPTTDGVWSAITVSGLPPNTLVARPSQVVTVMDGSDLEYGQVLTAAYSNSSGVAVIRLFEPMTLSGLVSIGGRESIVFEALDMPRSLKPAAGAFGYEWSFREVFEDEYESWTELDPWR